MIGLSSSELSERMADPAARERLAVDAAGLLLVDGTDADVRADEVAHLPVVIAALGDGAPPWADLVLGPDEATAQARLTDTIGRAAKAAVSLALLLRSTEGAGITAALVGESTTYSMLQAGPEFGAWLAARGDGHDDEGAGPSVLLDRIGDALTITLDRPARHNAFTPRMRDELAEGLHVALVDPAIQRIALRGSGPSFCSGGDLETFGRFEDPADAHLTRLTRSPASLLARLADRTTAHIHGNTLGAGIELAAFAHRVVADPDTRIGLPEVPLGLVPGAGGTVSIPRRIGRQLTARLALAETTIDAATAKAWGLVDEISPR